MVFPSSIPLYLDSPNWNQHPNQQLQATNSHHEHEHQHHHQLIPQPQQPAAHQLGIGGPGPGTGPSPGLQHGRPNSMTEQARQMKLPPPLAQQKCPRCASTNTKFCYYNNYNLSQPRHFCKACRRYWTHGGALRNVPIGGGCRKNKRSSSKSTPSSSSGTPKPSIMGRMDRLGSHPGNPSGGGGNSSLPFMSSTLQNLIHSGAVSHNMGLTYSGGPMHSSANHSGIGGLEFPHMNQRHLQFPNFLGGFEIPGSSTGGGLFSSSYQNVEDNNNNNEGDNDQEQQMNDDISKNLGTRMISSPQVKMEDNNGQRRLNLANQMLIMGISPTSNTNDDNKNNINNNNQYNWGSNVTNNNNNSDVVSSMWMSDLSGLNSSSNTSHLI